MRADVQLTTIERHIMETQKKYPEARGHLSKLLMDVAFAAKVISRDVRKAGLVGVLGLTGESNVQGEQVQKLDELANDVLVNVFNNSGLLAAMASEELAASVPVTKLTLGEYVVNFDPLDGSSNIDANISIGTIFSVLRMPRPGDQGKDEDLMQPGYRQVAAGYVIHGSSTMLVYSSGDGVHGFTLDPGVGEFLLSHPDIRIPDKGYIYSVNEAYYDAWSEGVRQYISSLKKPDAQTGKRYSLRYIGSMVADMHRTMLYGGAFLYPPDKTNPNGKLRLLYEASPMAFLCEQAGGAAVDGRRRILEVEPTSLHQRVPFFIGSKQNIEELMSFIRKYDK
ncbi:MAG: class 1 fructose-bisphosphatase [Myxococcales bacterium]|nr:MAG: class 1 fructose-bisphosphatase [Myxococcales bacterium]